MQVALRAACGGRQPLNRIARGSLQHSRVHRAVICGAVPCPANPPQLRAPARASAGRLQGGAPGSGRPSPLAPTRACVADERGGAWGDRAPAQQPHRQPRAAAARSAAAPAAMSAAGKPKQPLAALGSRHLALALGLATALALLVLTARPSSPLARPQLAPPASLAWAAADQGWRWPLPPEMLDRGVLTDGDPEAAARLGAKLLAGQRVTVGACARRGCWALPPARLLQRPALPRTPALPPRLPRSDAWRQPDLGARREPHRQLRLAFAAGRLARPRVARRHERSAQRRRCCDPV